MAHVSVSFYRSKCFLPIFLQAGNPEFERQMLEAGQTILRVSGFGMAPWLAMSQVRKERAPPQVVA
jgi:hypothetical protein